MSLPSQIVTKFPYGLERNTYFFGKLLTAEDFNLEQSYFLSREALVHHTFFGPGILFGLEVEDLEDHNQKLALRLTAGLAIDPQGRLIFIPREQKLEVPVANRQSELGLFLLYEECPREPTVTVCDPKECQPNRIREEFKVEAGTNIPEGIKIASLALMNNQYQLKAEPPLELPEKEFASPRLLNLPQIIKTLRALNDNLEKVKRELDAIPHLERKEFVFTCTEDKKEIPLEYKAKKLPLSEIICYLPIDYEISADTPETKHNELKEELNRGSLLLTAYHVKDFFASQPEGETETTPESTPHLRPMTLAYTLRPGLGFSPALRKFKKIRTFKPDTKLKDVAKEASREGVHFRIDPRLPLDKPLKDLADKFVFVYLYPVFDGTLLPYCTINFRDLAKGRVYFLFDWKSFKEEEPDLADMYLKKLKGIPFRLIFVGENQY